MITFEELLQACADGKILAIIKNKLTGEPVFAGAFFFDDDATKAFTPGMFFMKGMIHPISGLDTPAIVCSVQKINSQPSAEHI